MAKLVLLSAGHTGQTHDLNVDKTTIGRVEDNTFQIPEPSVSSHHCEILLRGTDVLVKDLNSTNGTFINGEKVTESVLKPGQTLRLGQIEMRLEAEGAPSTGTGSAPGPSAAPASSPKKPVDQTMVMQRGVKLDELDQQARTAGFDTAGTGFSKKDDRGNKIFWIIAAGVGVVIIGLLLYALTLLK
ncbi:MAG TPA: FHA domain-containing protein [Candidatus Dormibacteraeota bacterium]|nr:FHA domain-containing protein [Candidatus Dormibacteraeota bacterium]